MHIYVRYVYVSLEKPNDLCDPSVIHYRPSFVPLCCPECQAIQVKLRPVERAIYPVFA